MSQMRNPSNAAFIANAATYYMTRTWWKMAQPVVLAFPHRGPGQSVVEYRASARV